MGIVAAIEIDGDQLCTNSELFYWNLDYVRDTRTNDGGRKNVCILSPKQTLPATTIRGMTTPLLRNANLVVRGMWHVTRLPTIRSRASVS